MNHRTQTLLLSMIIIFVLGLASCYDDQIIDEMITDRPEPQELKDATLYGRVYGEFSDVILSNAEVTILNGDVVTKTQTDDSGYFLFPEVKVPRSVYISVAHDGYFVGRRRFDVISNKVNFYRIDMIQKNIFPSIDAKTGGVIIEGSTELTVPPNALVTADNNLYQGTVHAAIGYNMIGDFSGHATDGEFQALKTLGMITIQLFTDDGRSLKLAEGIKAGLKVLINHLAIDRSIDTVPLWSFDENIGLWTEASQATLSGGGDVVFGLGLLPSLGSWNFDYKVDPIDLSGQVDITYTNGSAKSNLGRTQVFIENRALGRRGGFTAPDGSYIFNNFPKDETFTLTVLNHCDELLSEKEFGPFSSDAIIDDIQINRAYEKIELAGKVQNCGDQPIEKGLVLVRPKGEEVYISQFENGAFSMTLDKNCIGNGEYIELSFMDVASGTITKEFVLTEILETDYDMGSVIICPETKEHVQFAIDGFPNEKCLLPFINLQPSTTYSHMGCGNTIISIFNFSNKGIYQADNIDIDIELESDLYTHTDPKDFLINITNFSTVSGESIDGTITGKVRKTLVGGLYGPPIPITGSFRIIND